MFVCFVFNSGIALTVSKPEGSSVRDAPCIFAFANRGLTINVIVVIRADVSAPRGSVGVEGFLKLQIHVRYERVVAQCFRSMSSMLFLKIVMCLYYMLHELMRGQ